MKRVAWWIVFVAGLGGAYFLGHHLVVAQEPVCEWRACLYGVPEKNTIPPLTRIVVPRERQVHVPARRREFPRPLVHVPFNLDAPFTIHLDGRITFGPQYQPNVATRLFLQDLARRWATKK